MLPWIVLLAPLAAAALILLFHLFARPLTALSPYVAILGVAVSCAGSWMLFCSGVPAVAPAHEWINLNPLVDFRVSLGFILDWMSLMMLVVVTSVGLLIFIYSLGYMGHDEAKSRYFGCFSAFVFSMLGIILANNFLMMFIFWELVGATSYLLIGHWFAKPEAADAAKKAFLVNRVADFGFMIGILLIFALTGTFVIDTTLDVNVASSLKAYASDAPLLTAATLLIFCGALGKSAQFPLHVWLPDAMQGPTPVSALIHSATMVGAGVYLLARVAFLIDLSPGAGSVIAWVGVITALLTALMATQQDDIKKILAYSTLSQLGYMVMAAGLARGDVALFHIFTNAFAKSLLFLGAGSIIHSLHHEQDIWRMGGLSKKMLLTFATFLLATLSLTGLPFFGAFFSKDMILHIAYEHNTALFVLAAFTALLTSFYMFRLVLVVFFGKPRSEEASHAHESPLVMVIPMLLLAAAAAVAGYGFVHDHFIHLHEVEGEAHSVPMAVLGASIGAFLVGLGAAFALYSGKTQDPLRITLLARTFYMDEFYRAFIAATQGALAWACAILDKWVLDGAIVRGSGAAAWGVGSLFRFLQTGNLQNYTFFFGLGVLLLLYLVLH